MEELLTTYLKPDMMILVAALFFIGELLKRSNMIKDELIPYILWVLGIALSAIYLFSKSPISGTYQTILAIIFEVIVQGTFCAAGAVFSDQLLKQYGKLKNTNA